MDAITLQRIETIHPILRIELRQIYKEICEAITSPYALFRFSQVLRSFNEQEALYAQGRTKPGAIVTNARGNESYHNYGMAVDIVQLLDKDKNGTFETASWDTILDADGDGIADWLEVVKIFNKYGWQWGLFNKNGKRYDLPHFQKNFGYSIKELKAAKKDRNGYVLFDSYGVLAA
ncbi:M15 family metallopeptidase [Gelidibacter sp.]|uniref:M15 family metallopeptidase n=1 Tax=Gelidibacter sp. TaxID=2018083 RepID=UPI002CC90615|nr:M15 family metallopeptidase [Gelidibacter sp.]HUH27679.1 M15 family metallopeptidase [Gelidibacter sp.]